jgi:hypothetical protein
LVPYAHTTEQKSLSFNLAIYLNVPTLELLEQRIAKHVDAVVGFCLWVPVKGSFGIEVGYDWWGEDRHFKFTDAVFILLVHHQQIPWLNFLIFNISNKFRFPKKVKLNSAFESEVDSIVPRQKHLLLILPNLFE